MLKISLYDLALVWIKIIVLVATLNRNLLFQSSASTLLGNLFMYNVSDGL